MNKLKVISLSLIILFSVSLNLFVLLGDKVMMGEGDSHLYYMLGKNLFEGKGYTIFGEPHFLYPPIPPLIIAFFFKLFGASEFIAALPWILFSALILILCYIFMNYFTDMKVAFFGTFLIAIHFDFVYLSTIIRADIIFMLTFYLFVFLMVKAFSTDKKSYFYLAAVVAGISNLTKYILGPFFFLIILYLLYKRRKQAFGLVFAMLLIFIAINSPWLYRNYYYHGTPFFSDYASVFKMYNNPADTTLYGVQQGNDDYYVEARYKDRSFKALFLQIKLFTKKIIINTASGLFYFLPKSVGMVVLFLAILNLFILLQTYPEALKKQIFVILSVLYIILFAIIFVQHLKFYTFLSPIFIMWGVQGCFRAVRILFKNNVWKNFIGMILLLLIIHSYVYTLLPTLIGNRVTSRFENPPLEGKLVGLWLNENIPQNASVMSTRIDFSFYGNKKYYITPLGNIERVKDYAKKKNVDYVIYDKRNSFYWRPEIRNLLDNLPKEGLELVHVHKDRDRVFDEVYVWKFMEN